MTTSTPSALSGDDLAALSRLLDQALDLEAAELEPWVATLPAKQAHLVPRLRSMLAKRASAAAKAFLAEGPHVCPEVALARAGERVGPYVLEREIGRGGMGSVWLADRIEGGVHRRVALKLPSLSWDEGLAHRMARERDIGARLEHPAIARLYDAGVDEHGRPYLAFEYIEGQPIDAWCAGRSLGIRERLRLFLQVLRAVSYAHAHLVVHRDIKPSNILVDAEGRAHLLDFGIAKLLAEPAANSSRLTREQGSVLTPQYASPEQILGEPITAVSDVYSLGVLLYELLTTQLPHAPRRRTPAAMEEAILAGDAPAASSRASDRAAARALRGDIDAILARALQREPGRRYASADAFADDIVRYLEGEVVRAKPDTPWYRLRKSLARHRLGFVFVVVLSMTILTGGTAFVVQAQRARDAAIRAQQVTLFVADVFRANAPGPQRHAGRLPEEGLLDMSARLIETRFAAEPALQAELYGVVAGIFSDMGASNSAADYVSRQLRALASANAPAGELAGAHLALARALFDEERLPDADAHARQALELGRRNILLKQDALLLLARIHTEQNNREEAARYTHLLGQFEPKRGTLQAWIKALEARRLDLDNRLEEAVPLFHQAVELATEAEGPDSPTTIDIRLQALGPCPDDQLHFVRHLVMPAIAALRRRGGAHLVRAEWIRAMRPDLFIDESPSANHPGMSIPDSIAIVEASRDSLRRQPMRVPEWMMAMIDMQLAGSKAYYGDIDTASALVADAGGWISKVAESREFAFRRVETLIGVAARSGRHDEVEQLLVQREAVLRGASNPNHPGHVVYYTARAMNLSTAGRHAEAENILNQAPHFDLLRDGTSYPDLADLYMLFYRARIALNRGDPQPALDLPTDRQLAGKGDVSLVTLALMKGEALCATGQARPGLRMLQDEVARISPLQHPNSPTLAYVRSQAGLCAFKSGDKRLARNLAREAREAFVAQPGVSPFYKAPLKSLEQSLRLHLPPV